ncbi:fibroblast growth factor 19 [Rhinophrynus dorsalis]
MPLFDAGPHVQNGWGDPIRIRHLYTARRHGHESYYLRIHEDGKVDGDRHQSAHSLLEIRAVAVGIVAIKGYHSSLYLCMGNEGRLYGMHSYSQEDCSFEEELLPDGYNMYKSQKYGIAVSLSKQKQHYRGKGFLPLSHFLPVINWVPMDPSSDVEDDDYRFQFNMEKKRAPFIDGLDHLEFLDIPSFQKK